MRVRRTEGVMEERNVREEIDGVMLEVMNKWPDRLTEWWRDGVVVES